MAIFNLYLPDRRLSFIIGLLLFSGIITPVEHIANAKQPDILILMPDQMRGDGLSVVGHPVVMTPNMDELAQTGALFRRAYSTVPSCTPARYAMLTGLYPQTSGVVGYTGTHVTRTTMPQLFRDAGYLTALVGRTIASDEFRTRTGL